MAWIEERRRSQRDGTLGPVKYRVHYDDPHARDRNKTFNTERAAKRFKAEVEVDLRRGDWTNPTRPTKTVNQLADAWWLTTEGLRPNTRRSYWRLLQTHIRPYFGRDRLGAVDTADVDAFIAAKRREGHSGKHIRAMVSVLSLIMDYAVRTKPQQRRDNPAAGHQIRGASKRVRQSDVLTMAQAAQLVEQTTPAYRSAMWVLLYTGIRPAELCGLLVGDIDFDRGVVHVDRTYSPIPAFDDQPRQHVQGPVKTVGGERSIPIPAWLVADLGVILTERAQRSGLPTSPGDPLFLNQHGRPVNRDTFRAKVVRPALRRAGLPESFRTYDTRHTHASLLIEEGASPVAVAERLGNDPVVTLRTYSHAFKGVQETLTARLEERRLAVETEPGRATVIPFAGRRARRVAGG